MPRIEFLLKLPSSFVKERLSLRLGNTVRQSYMWLVHRISLKDLFTNSNQIKVFSLKSLNNYHDSEKPYIRSTERVTVKIISQMSIMEIML